VFCCAARSDKLNTHTELLTQPAELKVKQKLNFLNSIIIIIIIINEND